MSMKLTIECNFEDISEIKNAINAIVYRTTLEDLYNFVRDSLKHGHQFKTPDDVLLHIMNNYMDDIYPLLFD